MRLQYASSSRCQPVIRLGHRAWSIARAFVLKMFIIATHLVSPAGRPYPAFSAAFGKGMRGPGMSWTGRKRAICQNARFRPSLRPCAHRRSPRRRVRAHWLRTTDLASSRAAAAAGDRRAAGQAHRHRLGRVHRPLRGGRGGSGARPRRRLRQLASSSRTARSCIRATCSTSSTRARSRRSPSRRTASSPTRAPRWSLPSASSTAA